MRRGTEGGVPRPVRRFSNLASPIPFRPSPDEDKSFCPCFSAVDVWFSFFFFPLGIGGCFSSRYLRVSPSVPFYPFPMDWKTCPSFQSIDGFASSREREEPSTKDGPTVHPPPPSTPSRRWRASRVCTRGWRACHEREARERAKRQERGREESQPRIGEPPVAWRPKGGRRTSSSTATPKRM